MPVKKAKSNKTKKQPNPKQIVTVVFNDGVPVDVLLRSHDSSSNIEKIITNMLFTNYKFCRYSARHKGIKSYSYKFFQYNVIEKDLYYKVPIFIDDSFYFRLNDCLLNSSIIKRLQRICKRDLISEHQ